MWNRYLCKDQLLMISLITYTWFLHWKMCCMSYFQPWSIQWFSVINDICIFLWFLYEVITVHARTIARIDSRRDLRMVRSISWRIFQESSILIPLFRHSASNWTAVWHYLVLKEVMVLFHWSNKYIFWKAMWHFFRSPGKQSTWKHLCIVYIFMFRSLPIFNDQKVCHKLELQVFQIQLEV